MNFLSKAHDASHQVLCQLIHSALFQTSTIALQKRLSLKLKSSNDNNDRKRKRKGKDDTSENDNVDNNVDNSTSTTTSSRTAYHITQGDVDEAYAITQRVGKKWMEKLEKEGEMEMAIIVDFLVKRGRFFEEEEKGGGVHLNIPKHLFYKSPTDNNADTLDSTQSGDVDKHIDLNSNMSDGNEKEENDNHNSSSRRKRKRKRNSSNDIQIHVLGDDESSSDNSSDSSSIILQQTSTATSASANTNQQGIETDTDTGSHSKEQQESHETNIPIPTETIIDDETTNNEIQGQKDVIDAFKSNVPFIALSKLGGGENPFKRQQQQNNNSTFTSPSHRESENWHPLPSISTGANSSARIISSDTNDDDESGMNLNRNHIPRCMNLSPEKLKKLPNQHQLYGVPFQTFEEHCKVFKCNDKYTTTSTTSAEKDNVIKSQIKILDELGRNGHTMWNYDWNIIQNAAFHNRDRVHLHVSSSSLSKRQGNSFFGQNETNDDVENVEEDNVNVDDTTTSNRNNIGNSLDAGVDMSPIVSGRIASDFGSATWSFEEIEKSFSASEIKHLHNTMVHKQNDAEQEQEKAYMSNCQKCVGALKLIGHIHLWEQLKQGNNWNGPREDPMFFEDDNSNDKAANNGNDHHTQKLRKKVFAKARRQRIYPNIESKKVDDLRKLSSKVSFTERNLSSSSSSPSCYFMELDLGECMMSLRSGSNNDDNDHEDSSIHDEPRNFIFRSLEISLEER